MGEESRVAPGDAEGEGNDEDEEQKDERITAPLIGHAPKRPLSPFIFYSQDARRIIKKENPQLHSKQIMK